MRVFSMALIAFAALTQAHAQEPSMPKKNGIACGYSINGYDYEVANGKSLCWRAPPPYGAEYALLQCYPPLTEVTSVKRGDPRCGGHYETRQ